MLGLRHEEEHHMGSAEGDDLRGAGLMGEFARLVLDEGLPLDPGEVLVYEEAVSGLPEVLYLAPVQVLGGALATAYLRFDLDPIVGVEEDQIAALGTVVQAA